MKADIKNYFEQNNGYLVWKQIPNQSMYKQLLKLIDEGIVIRVKRGVYCYEDMYSGTMIDIERVVPGGVLCLFSTWLHYELSTSIPQEYNIAIEKNRKVTLPDYPPIHLHRWKKEYYELGVTTEKIYDFTVKIYDVEKSVCDAIRFRNKVGIDTVSEILKNYLKRQDKDLDKLVRYAKVLRIEKYVREIIGMMI
jgi:hypothetical protein